MPMTPTPWILLRGLTRERGHWGDFPARLQARLGNSPVVALDLPGNGALHRIESPTRIAALTAFCRTEARRLGLAPPYRLLAISMGAMVAIDWAQSAPDEVAGCVLINTSLRPFDPFHQRLRPRNWGALIGLLLPGRAAVDRERTVLRLTSRNAAAAAAVLDAWVDLRCERPVAARNALRQLLAAARFRAPARAPAVPLLVLASARDGLVDPRCSLRLAARWHADLAVHAEAGHDLPLDDGAWLIERIAAWRVPCADAAGG
ncbi:MAG: alpha/beta hydrolase [Solirubrobacteraceae bacterium]|nr:alpha/beta hydrolase [Solirubrobacteraceae bacterium]